MPVSWRFVDGLVLLQSDDPGTFSEWSAAVDTALGDPGFKPGTSVVHDTRRMARIIPESEGRLRVSFISDRNKAFSIRRWALVVPAQAPYSMNRMIEMLNESVGVRCRLFTELAEALEWARAGMD